MDETRTVAELVRSTRVRAGLSQRALGEVLGLHESHISKIERGLRRLQFLEAVALAEACELSDAEWARLRQVSP